MNKVILIGRLVQDPKITNSPDGKTRAGFAVAVDRKYTDQRGNKQTDFIPCVAWRKTADFIGNYFTKGKKICVVGSIQVRTYDTQDKQKRYVTEVIVDEAEFVESKNAEETHRTEYTPGYAEQHMVEDNSEQLPFV